MIRVLLIAYYFPPMGGSGVQRPLKIGKYLAREGVEVTYLVPATTSYHISDSSLLKDLDPIKDRVQFLNVEGGIPSQLGFLKWSPLNWVSSNYRVSLSTWVTKITSWFYLPDNKRGWIQPALRHALKAHRKRPFDAVFATAAPYSNLLLAAAIKKETNLPVIMDLRDDWLHSHLLSYPTKWHYQRMAHLEKQTLQLADMITVINRGVQKSIQERLPAVPAPKVLPNGFDPEDLEVATTFTADFRSRFPKESFHILYNGLFYGSQQPDSFLKGIQLAVEKNPDLRKNINLHFQGDFFERHQKLSLKLGLDEMVRIHGNLPHRESVAGLLMADLLWLMVPENAYASAHTPGKLYEYFGTLKPILGLTGEGVTRELLHQYGACYLSDPNSAEEIANAVLRAYADWKNDQLPVGNRQFIQQFDRSAQSWQILQWIQNLAGDVPHDTP